jgi:hypothetical protein
MMMMFTLKRLQRGSYKMHNPAQKCRPTKGISKRISIQIIQDRHNSPTINNQNNMKN